MCIQICIYMLLSTKGDRRAAFAPPPVEVPQGWKTSTGRTYIEPHFQPQPLPYPQQTSLENSLRLADFRATSIETVPRLKIA